VTDQEFLNLPLPDTSDPAVLRRVAKAVAWTRTSLDHSVPREIYHETIDRHFGRSDRGDLLSALLRKTLLIVHSEDVVPGDPHGRLEATCRSYVRNEAGVVRLVSAMVGPATATFRLPTTVREPDVHQCMMRLEELPVLDSPPRDLAAVSAALLRRAGSLPRTGPLAGGMATPMPQGLRIEGGPAGLLLAHARAHNAPLPAGGPLEKHARRPSELALTVSRVCGIDRVSALAAADCIVVGAKLGPTPGYAMCHLLGSAPVRIQALRGHPALEALVADARTCWLAIHDSVSKAGSLIRDGGDRPPRKRKLSSDTKLEHWMLMEGVLLEAVREFAQNGSSPSELREYVMSRTGYDLELVGLTVSGQAPY
jgi:hypothetical protein